jgi:ribosomal protein S12 methylthiotransferase
MRLEARIGRRETVLIDEVVAEGAVARSRADAPEIDGQVFIDGATHLQAGEFADVVIEETDEHDMWAHLA